jgi:methylenetetrahydrofolate dehydrogenase (NADP+)/methenyltetrahydrofolate cyclohydrolase
MAQIIDGKQIAGEILDEVSDGIKEYKRYRGIAPGLAVVLVGDDPASQVYVHNKVKSAKAVGLVSIEYRLPEDSSQQTLNTLIDRLNNDPSVHGILVQLPLPEHLDANAVIDAIDPLKDVDGFHPLNVGTLALGRPTLTPCTPLGCMIILEQMHDELAGKNAVVLGCSNIVGKPMAALLLKANCSVTMLHKYSQGIPETCAQADILVVAVGQSEMVNADWIKPGATVLDVGINANIVDGKRKLTGDVDFAAAKEVAGAISPVPGGIGPMTIACLMKNTLSAAQMQLDAAPAEV